MITVKPTGPLTATVLVVGSHPSVEAEQRQTPFAGSEAHLLSAMLHEAGFLYTEVRLAYLCDFRPYATQLKYVWTLTKKDAKHIPDCILHKGAYCSLAFLASAKRLEAEIERLQPNLIIALGDAPLHYLTGQTSISKWRGSLSTYQGSRAFTVLPTFAPDQINRVWAWRNFAVRDLSRGVEMAKSPRPPTRDYTLRVQPTFAEATRQLNILLVRLNTAVTPYAIAADIETIARHIACVGFAWSETEAICIPLMDEGGGAYFTFEEEYALVLLMQKILCHPKINLIGQNFSYDTQHFVRSWGFRPRIGFDTMLAQHVCFPGTPKDLATLASLYCKHYVYWKDELTDYKKMPADVAGFWLYNCKDCCNTYEIYNTLKDVIPHLGFSPQFAFLQNLNHHVISMMIRGVRIDTKMKGKLALELIDALADRTDALHQMLGFPLNISSPKQMQEFFYGDLGMKPVLAKKTYNPTTDEGALKELASREPILRPLVSLINETRSVGVFLSTFVQMRLDHDARMRCSFNVGGTETFRFSSSGDAFGSGGNLQNIPKGNEDDNDLAPNAFIFPNVRRLFIPDPGMTLFDVDLAGADAQVVAWEAEDEELKAIFRSGQKIHAINAKALYGADAGPDGKQQPYYGKAKMGCHLCLADDHEVLTADGWQLVQEVSEATEIVVCSLDGQTAFFEKPQAWYHAQDTLEMLEICGQAYHQLVTPNHKLPYATDSKGVVRWGQARHLPSSARLPKTVKFSGRVPANPDLLRLLSAFHADGTIAKKQVRFHFKKGRKIARLSKILTRLGQPLDLREYVDGSTNIFIKGSLAEWLIEQGKCPTWTMLQWSRECLQAYVDELPHWDGCISSTSVSFSTVVPETAEIVHTLLHLCGQSGNTYPTGNIGGITVQINNRPLHRLNSGLVRRVRYTGGLHCPTVSTGFFLTRYKGKIAITGNTNYGGQARTLSKGLGMSMKEAEWFQKRWFDMHPGIKTWHEEVENSLLTTRSVCNKFGFRRFYFDRIEGLLPQALAWIPQSTVALVINNGLVRISESNTELELFLQVHDSLVGQAPTHLFRKLLPALRDCLSVTVPYDDPLVIGTSLDYSEKSWGDLISLSWEDLHE